MRTKAVRQVAAPLALYLALFCVLTFPWITHFTSHYWADEHDGLQNVWNLWWVDHAVTDQGRSPWHTEHLHHPHGTSLLGHTLNPHNGFIGIPLRRVFGPVGAHNFLILFAFVAAGFTTFLLAFRLTASWSGSLVAGCVFTFSSFHFGHAGSHLQMVSLQWLPAFVLFVYELADKPRIKAAVGAAVFLFLVLLCDYYYFLFCAIFVLVLYGWKARRERRFGFLFDRPYRVPLAVFGGITLATSGVLIGAFLITHISDPFLGSHSSEDFGMDLAGVVLPGAGWRFSAATEFYWSRLPANAFELSVFPGLTLIAVLILAWRNRKEEVTVSFWFLLILVFGLLALGPRLNIFGWRVPFLVLPYGWFEFLIPPLRMGGVPVRMMVMVFLGGAMLTAVVIRQRKPALLPLLVLASVWHLEMFPRTLPMTDPSPAEHARKLKELPKGAVLDLLSRPGFILLDQTHHEKPVVFGYVSRYSENTLREGAILRAMIRDERWGDLRKLGIRYVVTRDPPRGAHALGGNLFDLGP